MKKVESNRKILIAGGSGLIGSALTGQLLRESDCQITTLSRQPRQSHHPGLSWVVIPDSLPHLCRLTEGSDIIVNLSGESLASGYWTRKRKRLLYESRIHFTERLCQAIIDCRNRPRLYIQASAIGFYGSSEEEKDEKAPPENGFLAGLCRDWETASSSLEAAGIQRVICRLGIVLSRNGGFLPRVAAPLRYGLSFRLGSGKQWMSWIHIDDLCAAVIHLMNQHGPGGPYNFTAPHPIRHRLFMEKLAQAMHRSPPIGIPTFFIHRFLGEMADELLLSSQRIVPHRLIENGFKFKFTSIDKAVASLFP